MTTYPSLKVGSTLGLLPSPQVIQNSIRGSLLGIGSTGTLIGPSGYPFKPEAGVCPVATTADIIGNYGTFTTSSSAVSAIFTVADPVPGCTVKIVLNCGVASTAVKFVTASSNVTFSSSANSNGLLFGSSLFFGAHAFELMGQSTAAYRVMGVFWGTTAASILPTYTT